MKDNTFTKLEKDVLELLETKVNHNTLQALKYGNVLKNLIAGCKGITAKEISKEVLA